MPFSFSAGQLISGRPSSEAVRRRAQTSRTMCSAMRRYLRSVCHDAIMSDKRVVAVVCDARHRCSLPSRQTAAADRRKESHLMNNLVLNQARLAAHFRRLNWPRENSATKKREALIDKTLEPASRSAQNHCQVEAGARKKCPMARSRGVLPRVKWLRSFSTTNSQTRECNTSR